MNLGCQINTHVQVVHAYYSYRPMAFKARNIKFDELIHVDFTFPKGEHFIILIIIMLCLFLKEC